MSSSKLGRNTLGTCFLDSKTKYSYEVRIIERNSFHLSRQGSINSFIMEFIDLSWTKDWIPEVQPPQ